MSVHNIGAAIRREMPVTPGKRVYLSKDPCLALSDFGQHHIHFRRAADGLGVFASDVPDHHRIIEQSGLLKTGAVKQIPESLLSAE